MDYHSMKRPLLYFYITLLVLLAIVGLWWLGLSLLLFVLICRLYKRIGRRRFKAFSFILFFLGIIVFAIWIRVFVAEVFLVPSSSMENTIFPGDKIFVSKLSYGPRLPQNPYEIPWINLFFLLGKEDKVIGDSNERLSSSITLMLD